MRLNLSVATRVFPGWAALAILLLPAPLYGAQAGFPFSEDFQSQSFLDSTRTTARWTNSGVTLGHARGRHMVDLGLNPGDIRIGNSTATTDITDIGVRDMDGDGRLDVITAGVGGVFVYYVDEVGGLRSIQPVRITPVAPIKAMALGDFDRDGNLDVAVAADADAVIVYRNRGSRSFFDAHSQVSSLRAIALVSADMDGDGALDLLLVRRRGTPVQVHLNDGEGNFSLQSSVTSTVSGQNKALGVGDLDSDGDMDIVLAKVGGVNVFYQNDGNTGFDARALSPPGGRVDYRTVAVGDVNNDGHLDIVVGVYKAQNLLYLNDGSSGFGTGSRINNNGARTSALELADMDGDGDLDIVEGKGSRIYLNRDGVFDSGGSVISGKTNDIAVGDVDGDGHLDLVRGKTPAELEVATLTERRTDGSATSRFDTGRGRVVSGKVNGNEAVPHVVYLTATAVQALHTDIEYYLSNDGGGRWIRAYPGETVRFPVADNDLRWRAELKSRSPVRTATLTRVGIENVLQVSIDGSVFRNGETYTATSQTVRQASNPVPIRLVNRGNRALTITGIETIGTVFSVQEESGKPLPQVITQGVVYKPRLVFTPTQRGMADSMLTISGSEGGNVLPEIKVMLMGQGVAAEISVVPREDPIKTRVGTSKSQAVKVENKGENPLTIASATAAHPVFRLIEPATLPATLTVSNPTQDFKFLFEPMKHETVTTTITFVSNAINGTQTRTLTGKGLAPVIEIPPPEPFRVRVGGSTTREVVIRNNGDWEMNISDVKGTNTLFSLVTPTEARIREFGLRVAEGTSEKVVFSFTPESGKRSSPAADITFTSDAFNATQTTVTLQGRGTAPMIAFRQEAKINFGAVRVGTSKTASVVIENTGEEPLIVSGVRAATSGHSLEDVISLVSRSRQTVPADATATLTLRFMPTTRMSMPLEAALIIDSDAINMPEGRLTVRGEGVAPVMAIVLTNTSVGKLEDISSSVSSHDFGDVAVNTGVSRRVFISNDGDASLEVTPRLAGGRGFRWESTPSGVIGVMAGGSTSGLIVHFEPEEHGPHTAGLIFSDTLNNLRTTVTLTGRGVGMPRMEVFLQKDERERHNAGQLHDLGNVTVGRPVSTLIYLGNSGTASLGVTGLEAAGGGFIVDSELAALPEPGVVGTGVSGAYVGALRFDPVGQGVQTGTLTIRSNDANGEEFTIPLRANAVSFGLDIRIDGEQINQGDGFSGEYDFGEVIVGESETKTITIDKTAGPLVTIRFIYLADDGGGQFEVVSSRLPAWGEGSRGSPEGDPMATSSLSFTPTETGSATAVLVIRQGGSRILSTLTFRAAGVAPRMSVEMGGQTVAPGAGGHDFGMVSADAGESTTVTVSNNGDGDLKISSIRAAGAGYRLDGPTSGVIAADSSADWTMHFTPPGDAASYRGVLTIAGNDREAGPQGVRTLELKGGGARAAINPAENAYDFGHVRVGASATVAFSAAAASVTSGGDVYRVAPGGSTGAWELSFAPTSAGDHTGELEMDGRLLGLKGAGAEPRMTVAIDGSPCGENCRHDFGETKLASTMDTVRVIVSNTGTVELDISSIGVTGDGYSLADADVPQTVAPGGSTAFPLRFSPTLPEPLTGTLSIVSDDPRQRHWSASVTGHGKGPRLALKFEGRYISDNELLIRDYPDGQSSVTYRWDIENSGNENLIVESYDNEGWDHIHYMIRDGSDRGLHPPQTVSPKDRGENILSARAHVGGSWRWPTRGLFLIGSNDPVQPVFRFWMETRLKVRRLEAYIGDYLVDSGAEYDFGDVPVGGDSLIRLVRVYNAGGLETRFEGTTMSGSTRFSLSGLPVSSVALPDAASSTFNLSFAPMVTGTATARLTLSTNDFQNPYVITLRGNGVPAVSEPVPSAWAGGAQRPAIPAFAGFESADAGAPGFVGLGYADAQSRLWSAFDEPVQILSDTNARTLSDGAALSGFEVLPNYVGGEAVENIGVLHARYRSGGVVMELARNIAPADASVWVRYTPPSDGAAGIYDTADPPNRISTVRLFMLPRSVVLDYDGDGFPDALEARLGGNPLVADDADLPQVSLLRPGAAGSPAAVAYSGIRADGVAAHLGVVTTGASSLAAYYLSDTFGYSGGYAQDIEGYGCTGQFPSDYASPVAEGGCAVADFNNIRAGIEHRIGWLALNAAGYWAVAKGTTSRLPEQVILRVPEFNMQRRNVFLTRSAAADAAVRVGAFHDGPASSQSLTVSLSNVAAADSPSSKQPDGFSVSVADVTTNTTNYAITGVHAAETNKLWLAGDPLSSLTPDRYSLGKVTQTSVVRLGNDNLPPLFGRASLYAGSTASANERHAVTVRGTENYIALLPVVHGSAETASAFEVSPWDGPGGGEPVAAANRMIAVNTASPVADGALVRIAFTASNPPETVRNTVSLEVAASSAGADTATTVLTWPVTDSADALATIAGDGDSDGIPDIRDSYRLLNRLPVSVAGGASGYPERSTAGADGWHHIRPLLPLHSQHIGGYATRAGLSFHTGFDGDVRILAQLYIATPEQQSPLSADYQSGVPVQMNYTDFAASLSRDEFNAMVHQSRHDVAVVYNFRLHGVEPVVAQGAATGEGAHGAESSAAQGASLAGGRTGVVIPLPESLHDHTNILPLHYTGSAWSGFSGEAAETTAAGFAPLQAGVCPDDSGLAASAYRTAGVLNSRKRAGDACMVLYLTDGAAADRDGNINGVVDALIGLAAIVLPR